MHHSIQYCFLTRSDHGFRFSDASSVTGLAVVEEEVGSSPDILSDRVAEVAAAAVIKTKD
jgi:hypothetical protein